MAFTRSVGRSIVLDESEIVGSFEAVARLSYQHRSVTSLRLDCNEASLKGVGGLVTYHRRSMCWNSLIRIRSVMAKACESAKVDVRYDIATVVECSGISFSGTCYTYVYKVEKDDFFLSEYRTGSIKPPESLAWRILQG